MSTFFDIRNWFEFGIDAIEIDELETPRLKDSGSIEQPVWTLLQNFAASVPCVWFIGEHAIHSDAAEAAIERLVSSGVAWETRRFPGFGKVIEASAEFQGSWGNRGFVFPKGVELEPLVDVGQLLVTDACALLLPSEEIDLIESKQMMELVGREAPDLAKEPLPPLPVDLTESFVREAHKSGVGVVMLRSDGTTVTLFPVNRFQTEVFRSVVESL